MKQGILGYTTHRARDGVCALQDMEKRIECYVAKDDVQVNNNQSKNHTISLSGGGHNSWRHETGSRRDGERGNDKAECGTSACFSSQEKTEEVLSVRLK